MANKLSPLGDEPELSQDQQEEVINSAYKLMQHLGVPTTKWHMLATTDGSGCKVGNPIGYASIIYQRHPQKIKHLVGAASFGGVNEAETRAVFDVVSYALRSRPPHFDRGYYLHIVTDSEYVRRALEEIDPVKVFQRKTLPHLWQGIAQARRRGIMIVPHFIHRNTYPPMEAADMLSKLARKSIEGVLSAEKVKNIVEHVQQIFPMK